jgi:hypothetical protein
MKRNEHRHCIYVDLMRWLYTTFDLVVLDVNDVPFDFL